MTQKNLSPFGEAAVALDIDFTELQELGGQLERLDLASDSGLDRGKGLLVKFSTCGQRVGEGLQKMAAALEEARARAEKTAELASARAGAIQARQNETDQMLTRFQALGDTFKQITVEIAALQKPVDAGGLNDDEKARLIAHLPQLDAQLATLIGDARRLRDDASEAKMKTLEKNADSLAQALQSMRGRLDAFVVQRSTAGPNLRAVDLH